jgi:uncharacterized coiled-coil protein SlyX
MRAITSSLRRYPDIAALLLGCTLILLPAQVWSATTQGDALAEMQKKLDQSLQAIQALTQRVSELEGKLAASQSGAAATAPVAANPPAPESARLEADEQKIEQLEH